MDTQALQPTATHLETLYDHDAPPSDFADWVGRAGVLLGVAGLLTLHLQDAPQLSVASAWGAIAGTLLTAIGGVCSVAWASAGMNRH